MYDMYNMKATKVLIVFIFILMLLFSGCTGYDSNKTAVQHIKYGLCCEPATLDPAKVADSTGKQMLNALFEGLVRLKPDGTYEKAMAESWDIEKEGLRYIFKIREAKWSNGERVTAHDFEYAWKRVLDPATGSPYAYLLYNIKDAQGYHRSQDTEYRGKKKKSEEVGIKALDENVLVVELAVPDPAFINKLVHPVFLPLPQESVEVSAGQFFTADNIKGNGPFIIAEHNNGENYELVKNNYYWDQQTVKLEKISMLMPGPDKMENWEMYNRQQLDITVHAPADQVLKGLSRGSLSTSPLLANYFYEFNVTKEPLNDKRVREALSYSLDRKALVSGILQGGQKPARGLVPEGVADLLPGTDFRLQGGDLVPDNNTEEARRLLAEAGYPGGESFPKLILVIDDRENHFYLASFLQNEWKKKLGIEIEIISLNWQDRVKRVQEGEYDIALMGWSADYIDAAAFLERYIARYGNNDTGWNNPEFNECMRLARIAPDEKERLQILHKAEALLLEELPVLPLYDYTRVYAVHKWIKGCFFPQAGPEAEFKWAYVE